MVMLIKDIQEVLNCSEIYAQKILEYADGDKRKLNYQIDRQLYKQRNNQAILEVKPDETNRGIILKQKHNSLDYIQKYKYA